MDRDEVVKTVFLGVYTGVAVSAGILFGYLEGYGDAMDGGFGPGVAIEDIETEEEHVIDGYTIRLQDWNISEHDGMTGYTTGNDDIYIRANRSVRSIYTTCVHEKLHNLYPEKEHDWIYPESNRRIDPTCLKLLTQLNTSTYTSDDITLSEQYR